MKTIKKRSEDRSICKHCGKNITIYGTKWFHLSNLMYSCDETKVNKAEPIVFISEDVPW